MKTLTVIFAIMLSIMCVLFVVQVIDFFCDVPKELKRIADELKKMNERKGGDER